MTFDSQQFESYVPVYDVVPERWEDARPFLVEQLKRIANAVNIREIGWFLDEELLSGKSFIPGINNDNNGASSQQFRSVLRKVIDFGALPNTAGKAVLHGIDVTANFTLVHMFAAATDPIGLQARPIPNTGIEMYMDDVNVYIITTSNLTAYTRCFVTIEYIQEV